MTMLAEVIERARVGALVYHWSDPPEPGSLRLVLQNAAARALGSAPADVGRTLRETNPRILETPVIGHYIEALTHGTRPVWSIEWRFADGRVVPYEAHCYALEGQHVAVFFENVSEKRAAQDALARHVRELERSNRDLDEFAYVASHDLKSPLRDIHNLASFILEDLGGRVPAPTQKHLELLQDRVRRMDRLLEDLLEYSRAGRDAARAEDVLLPQMIDEVREVVAMGGHRVEVSPDAVPIHAPRAALELVLRNLVGNAVRHHDREDGVVRVSATLVGDSTMLSVEDDGPGIAPEHHQRVFRMFQTLPSAAPTAGTGIGLALVKRVVEGRHGRVELVSAGRGTTVRTYWPRREEGQ